MLIGYFNLFDLGLGRALTKLVAERIGKQENESLSDLVWTALIFMFVLGIGGALLIGGLTPWLVYDVLKIPAALQPESQSAFYILSLSLPFVITVSGLRGILEAHQRFDLVNAVRIPMGAYTFLGPLVVLPFNNSLTVVVAVLAGGRVLGWLVHLGMSFKVMPNLRRHFGLHRGEVMPLLRFGSWMTVTNIVGPLMVRLDRFLIGAMISTAAVAYYATPYEMVWRLTFIPVSVVSVLFPAFSTSLAAGHERPALLFNRGVKYLFCIMFPITLILITLAHEGLTLWLGTEFARMSTPVLQLLSVGIFINSLARVPFVLLQGIGRPDVTAKLHLLELPLYLALVWWLIGVYGIVGAAIAWVARILLDTALLFIMAKRFMPVITIRKTALSVGIALVVLAFASLIQGPTSKIIFPLLTSIVFMVSVWRLALTPEEKGMVKKVLNKSNVFTRVES